MCIGKTTMSIRWAIGAARTLKTAKGSPKTSTFRGYLSYWDELCRRHPKLWIDSCASGGRRNDLETMRRSVPLLRSDCFTPEEAQQGQTYGLSLWIPYHGSGAIVEDACIASAVASSPPRAWAGTRGRRTSITRC